MPTLSRDTSRRRLRRTPRLTLDALRMVWAASPRHLLAVVVLQVAAGAGAALQLLVLARIMQALVAVSHGGAVSALYVPFSLLVGTTIVLGAIGAVTGHQQRLLTEFVGRATFDRIIGVASSVDYRAFESSEFYDELQRAKGSGQYRPIEIVGAVSALLTALLTSAGIAAVLFLLEPLLLGLVALAALPPLLAGILNSRASYAFEYAMTAEARERAYVVDLLTDRQPAKEVRLFGLGRHLRLRYERLTDERLRHLRAFLRKRLQVGVVGTVAGAAATGVALAALILLLRTERIGVAAALTAGVAMQQLGGRLNTVTGSLTRLVESGMFIDDFKRFLELGRSATVGDRTATPVAGESGRARRRLSGLAVENVTFAYPGSETVALERVSLEVDPGEVVALVGENGSGKTTLVKLICQLYRPAHGRILWNGVDSRELRPEDIREDMTVLFQDFIQYHLTAADNISFGRIERAPSSDAVAAAAAEARAHEFLSLLPAGYDTRLGREFEGGYELSIGQWQRLALARAFYRDADFLIMDEPTASLDPRAEHDLFAQIRQLAAGRSVLLISHRFSSVRSADRIYVLHEGRIIEQGTHEQLMQLGGHYAELFTLQAAAYIGEHERGSPVSA